MTVLAFVALALGALTALAAAAYRRRGPDLATRLLDDEEAAYLTGGRIRAVNTAMYRLAEGGAIRVSREYRVTAVERARPATAVEAVLLRRLHLGEVSCVRLRNRVLRSDEVRALERRLRQENLAAPGPFQIRLFGAAAVTAAAAALVIAAVSGAAAGLTAVVLLAAVVVLGLAAWTLLPANRPVDDLLAAYDQGRGNTTVGRVARHGLAQIPDESLRSTLLTGLTVAGARPARRSRWIRSGAAANAAYLYGNVTDTGYGGGGGHHSSGGGHHSCGGGGHHSCGGGSSCGGGW